MIAFEVFRICDKKNICERIRHKCRLHPVKLIIFQNFNPFAKLYTHLLNLNRKFQTHLKVFKLKINFCGLLHHISLLHFCKKRVLMTFFIPTYFFKSQSTRIWRIRYILHLFQTNYGHFVPYFTQIQIFWQNTLYEVGAPTLTKNPGFTLGLLSQGISTLFDR